MAILRALGGGLVGYVVMVLVSIGGIAINWALVGGGPGAFQGEGPDPSTLWLIMSCAFGLVAAFVGGLIARKIGGSMAAVNVLMGLIALVGLTLALGADSAYENRERVDKAVADMTFAEAGQHAKQPAWYNWTIPLVGLAGAAAGGRRAAGKSED